MVPSSNVSIEVSDQVCAPSFETFIAILDVDQVVPGRTTYQSQIKPSGACHTTGFPTE